MLYRTGLVPSGHWHCLQCQTANDEYQSECAECYADTDGEWSYDFAHECGYEAFSNAKPCPFPTGSEAQKAFNDGLKEASADNAPTAIARAA